MAESKKSLGAKLTIPIEAVGEFLLELGPRAVAWGLTWVDGLSPNTAHPRAAQALATGKAKAQQVRTRGRGRSASPRSTSQIAQEIFEKANGAVVLRGTIAKAFEDEGFSAKSAQTLLERWMKSKKIERVEAGKYRWIA